MDMALMFATEQDAVEWFEAMHWPDGKQTHLPADKVQLPREWR